MALKALSTQRSGALDVFRFLAVLTIFLAHYADTYNYKYQIVPQNLKWSFFTRYSVFSLFVFFIVSGYVITMTSMKRDLRHFLTARLSRIYPLFWISCITAFILPRLVYDHTYLLHAPFRLFLANMTMVPQIFGYEMINPVFWTLVIELTFYFFIALIILFKLWNKLLLIFTCAFICCIICTLKGQQAFNIFLPFSAGMLLYFIRIKYASHWKLHCLLVANFLCTLIACQSIIKNPGISYKDSSPLNVWITVGIITTIYILLYLIATRRMNIKDTVVTRFLGEIAYPFYLFHIYFLFLYWYFRNTIQADLLLIGILLLIIIVSWILNVAVEKPLSKKTHQVLYSITNIFTRKKNARTYLSGQEPPPL